jgi:hypothetical protein
LGSVSPRALSMPSAMPIDEPMQIAVSMAFHGGP